MQPLTVLITQQSLAIRGGSTAYTRDLAVGLLRQGHHPIVYSTDLGDLAREIRLATVPVVDDLGALSVRPDVVHGNHHAELITALLRFPAVPGVHACHAWYYADAFPPRFPRIRRYVAVDDTCRDRLVYEEGIPEDRVRVVFNAVDLTRFRPRPPLPARPRRAVVFSNYASEGTHLPVVREVAARLGVTLEVIGEGAGVPHARPEEVLGQFDLVFAKARCALEAMAVGAAVVLCDATGSGPLVTAAEVDRLRRLNFGIRALAGPLHPDLLTREASRYDPDDAREVSRRIRAGASLETKVGELLAVYAEVLAEQARAAPGDPAAEARAAADYLRWVTPQWRETLTLRERLRRVEEECRQLRARAAGGPPPSTPSGGGGPTSPSG
ncbi:MAG TPA: glycosyltransferase family 4 protein [Vicinamibacteria bacterium]